MKPYERPKNETDIEAGFTGFAKSFLILQIKQTASQKLDLKLNRFRFREIEHSLAYLQRDK